MKLSLSVLAAASLLFLGCFLDSPAPTQPPGASSSVIIDPYSSSSTVVDPGPTVKKAFHFGAPATTANPQYAIDRYNEWKTQYYVTVENEAVPQYLRDLFPTNVAGSARIKFDNDSFTVSEGIGYGMLNAYFMSDWDAFNRLWTYHKAFRPDANNYLMIWKVYSFYQSVSGSATDADMDVATALLLAYEQFPTLTAYKDDALQIANQIYNTEIKWQDGSMLILPGDAGWSTSFNPSYFSPVALRLFAKHDPSHPWADVLEKNYNWIYNINAAGFGLWPDWVNQAGVPTKPENSSTNSVLFAWYSYESYRTPWRLAWDYAWFGDARALNMLNRATAFISAAEPLALGGVSNVKERYQYAGDQKYGVGGSGAKAALCAVALADPANAAWLADCTPKVSTTPILAPVKRDYFNPILQVMYSQLLNGLYVRPF
jgi:endo-1,4-beta-D-glucanase Y